MPLIPGICSLSGNNKRNWDLQRNRIMIEYVKMNDDNMDCVIKKYIEYYNNVENITISSIKKAIKSSNSL